MKRLIVLIGICLPLYINANNDIILDTDTILYINNKKIEIREDEEKMKVRVYELTEQDEYVEAEKIFEGHYRDGQSYERRKHPKTISIPVPTWHNSGFDGHWEGIGIGFANFADGSLHVNDINGVTLNSGKSLEYNLNLFSYGLRLGRTNMGVVTGIGMRWNRYRIKGDQYFKEVDGVTQLLTLSEDYNMRASKLNTTSITIPILLEWQNSKRSQHELFFSAGIVGVIKTISSSKIVYYEQNGSKIKEKVDGGMNIHPVSMDLLIQGGINWFGVYAKYSPFGLFAHNKGPKIHPVSFGFQFFW